MSACSTIDLEATQTMREETKLNSLNGDFYIESTFIRGPWLRRDRRVCKSACRVVVIVVVAVIKKKKNKKDENMHV